MRYAMDKNKAALEALDRLLLKIERSILTHTEIEGYGEDVGRVRAYLTEPVIDDALSRWEMDVMDKTIKSWDVSAIENQKQPVIEDKKPSKYVTVYDKNGSRSQLRGYHTPDVVSRVPHEQEPVIPDAALREAVEAAIESLRDTDEEDNLTNKWQHRLANNLEQSLINALKGQSK